jgi:hypothetical protein
MNFFRLSEELAMFENALRVRPGSVKDHLQGLAFSQLYIGLRHNSYPPTDIQVCRPLFLSFKAVNR